MFLCLSVIIGGGIALYFLIPNELKRVIKAMTIPYYAFTPQLKEYFLKEKLEKWNNTPKDVVIIHAVPRGRTISHPSPYVVKAETFLRLAGIPFKADFEIDDAYGPKGRFPWISLNGEHLGDSDLIIQFLKKKFPLKLGSEYSKEEQAIGAVFAAMMDHHAFWGMALHRFVWGKFSDYLTIVPKTLAPWMAWLYRWNVNILKRAKGHGIGLHSQKEVEDMVMQDLQHLSNFIGEKKFLLGNAPSEFDAAIFAHLAQMKWACAGSVYSKAIVDTFPNLDAYCNRIKEQYYPEWDSLLLK